MGTNKKPRKAYRPRPVDPGATIVAMCSAAKLPQDKVRKALAGIEGALLDLQRGIEPEFKLRVLSDMLNVAEQLARLGICSDEESCQVIGEGQLTVARLCEQHAATGSWTMRAADIAALREAMIRHCIQLQHCSHREYESSLDAVERIVSQALAGNAGHKTIVIGHIDGSKPWRLGKTAA